MSNPEDQSQYWNSRYTNMETGWDVGYISTPLKEYFDQLDDRNLTILIPGAGNAYEAEYLFEQGFKNVIVLDFSTEAIESFKKRVPAFPDRNIVQQDFFEHSGSYDLIVEQTFFCALNPKHREHYVRKMNELLKEDGKLVGLLFDDRLNDDRPPYGGSRREYKQLFERYFTFTLFETAYNSIKPREGREIFINLKKK